jgi:probable F420-dependent oxidoreductase
MDAPRFSVGLPQTIEADDPRPIVAYAQRAERLGFTGLWALDSAAGGPTSHTPLLDAAQVLAFAAAVTREIRLGVAVIVMGRRQPVLLAKEMASLDRLSGGRLTVGVGLGAPAGEKVAALGFPVDRAVRRLVEGVEIMRALWSSDAARHEGELYRFAGVDVEPKPRFRHGPPIWFGAGREPALRRAARLADGWIGAGSSSADAFVAQVPIVREELAAAGRDAARFAIAKRVYVAVEDDEAVARRRAAAVLDPMYGVPGLADRCAVCGPPERVAETVRAVADAGAQEVLLNPVYGHLAQLERLPEVVRLVRGA